MGLMGLATCESGSRPSRGPQIGVSRLVMSQLLLTLLNMYGEAVGITDGFVNGFAQGRVRMNGRFEFLVRGLKVDRKAELGD
jgi:hypothetical protein